MKTPLRSLMIGDTDHYFSPYIFGVDQACARLGIWHSQVSIRSSIDVIRKRLADVQPNLIWTHMMLWPPKEGVSGDRLIELCRAEKNRGAHIMLHDGDVKKPTRFPYDLSGFVSLALCNHEYDRSAWKVPQIYWPYAAFPQDELAEPVEEWKCDVAFAGQLSKDKIYSGRTKLVSRLMSSKIDFRIFNPLKMPNTMLRTPELSVSAFGILGFGRPEVKGGWVDTRVFQYPGAGAILIHDDVRGFLEPNEHYMPYRTGNSASVVEAVDRLWAMSSEELLAMRMRAMSYTQDNHSWTARVKQVLRELRDCA